MSDNKTLKPGWKIWRFDQMATNFNVRIDNPSESGMEHYVGLEHLDSNSLKIRRWGTPNDVEASKLMFKKGDIIFGRRRAYQRKIGVAEFDGICSAHAMVLRAKPDVVLPEFLPFFMQADLFMKRAVEISVGSLSPTINWKTMAAQEFALPPLEEQRRCVQMFIAASEAENEARLLSISAAQLLASMRGSVFERTEERLRLADVAETITSGSRGWAAHYSSDGEQFLRVGNLSHHSIELNLSDLQRVTAPDDLEAKRAQVRVGDVLLGITGEAGVGRVGLVREGVETSYVSQHIALIRLDGRRADPQFVAHMLAGHDGQRQVFRSNQAGAKAGLTLKAVEMLCIPALEIDEQRAVADLLTSIQRAGSDAQRRGAGAAALYKESGVSTTREDR